GSSTCPGKAMAFRISVNFCPPVTQSGNSGGDASVLRSAVTLGPNPAGSSIRLQYAGNARRLTVEVRDAVGRTAIAANSFTGSGITLQTAALLPGTYYAVLSDPATGTQVSLLFVKQ
ncbi:MAG: T9SS type A sorting domain-containing protein, partial [Chitinophagaceae bacterium]